LLAQGHIDESAASGSEDEREEDMNAEARRSAADRLTAYNISDDSPEHAMEVEAGVGADDDDFEPEASASEEDSDVSDEDED